MNKESRTREHVRNYRNQRYKNLDQRIIHSIEARIIDGFLSRVAPPGAAILDMPVGYGRFMGTILDYADFAVGGDRKQAMLELVRETHGSDFPVVRHDCAALPFADNSFDVVTCIRLFQHLHDPAVRAATFSEIARVSRGHAIVTTYLDTPLHDWLHRSRKLKRLTRHSTDSLHRDLDQAGLRLVTGKRSIPGLHAQYTMLLEKTGAPSAQVA